MTGAADLLLINGLVIARADAGPARRGAATSRSATA